MTDEINAYRWAQENLSPARARAFEKAYKDLERSKFSEEYRQEWRKEEEIRIAFIRANLEKTNEIQDKAHKEAEELESQAQELMARARQIKEQAREEASKIQSGVYDTEEYKAQRDKVSELWRRDNAIIQPKIKALMDRYLEAQNKTEKAGA